jgi:hypothetical protein
VTVGCPRCPAGTPWRATGVFNAGLHVTRRAELVCDGCRRRFSSGLPEALEAGDAARAAQGSAIGTVITDPDADLFTPAPRLMTVAPRSQDTVTRAQLEQRQRWRRVKWAQAHAHQAGPNGNGRPPR